MIKEDRTGKVQTVLGLIDAESLGITLPHEHLLKSAKSLMATPSEASEQV